MLTTFIIHCPLPVLSSTRFHCTYACTSTSTAAFFRLFTIKVPRSQMDCNHMYLCSTRFRLSLYISLRTIQITRDSYPMITLGAGMETPGTQVLFLECRVPSLTRWLRGVDWGAWTRWRDACTGHGPAVTRRERGAAVARALVHLEPLPPPPQVAQTR